MSEQKTKSFMQELDLWIENNVVGPLAIAGQEDSLPEFQDFNQVAQRVNKAIRAKVLESYGNGQAAGPTKLARKEPRR